MSSYDGSVSLPRKLTDEEVKELRISLMPYFHLAASDDLGPEDISDFLDYAFAMISNGKSVDFVIQELLGMEMDFCTEEVADKVGREMSVFLRSIVKDSNNEDGPAPGDVEGDDGPHNDKNSKVVSLKVR
jgi:hypothetical protein